MMTNDGADRQLALQDRYFPDLPCFGCGPANPKGLQLKSYRADDHVTATFVPWPEHDNGLGFLNGGIICTILDCHSAAAVITTAVEHGILPSDERPLPYVTAGLDVRYLRPSPLHDPVLLRATASSWSESEVVVDVSLWWEGKERAAATALWKRWRAR